MNAATIKPIERLWKAKDVMAFLGCGKTFVYENAASGNLPSFHVGGLLRFDPDQVRAWAQRRGRGKVIPIAGASSR